jgi:geranylgeranyl diphosphate synthase type I
MTTSLDAIVAPYGQAIEVEMRSLVDERQPPAGPHTETLYHMLAYHLGWRDANLRPAEHRTGKWIRPVMCLLACEAAGGVWKTAVPAAAALELTHNFTLVHDDIQDGDRERRGRPTVWRLWGVPQAINVGDSLFVLAYMALHRLHTAGYDATTVNEVGHIYLDACRRLVEGQYQDIDFEDRLDISVDGYLRMISGKTAALLAASLAIGARLALDDAAVVDAYRLFGEELGLTFQIVDDILGIWGDESVTGKPAGNDLRRKKKSLPVVYVLERESGREDQPLSMLYQQPALSDADVEMALDILAEAGARRYAEDLAAEHSQRASAVLDATGIENAAQARLHALAELLIQRDY